ncbi:ABC transporter ATP-binding protein [Brevibacillus humidisoli]|uniref:ABC transporter ATP-binding protein n=1 Tax=Brevibacillus humidisoli TaxID=2895522 RepID=UPI001E33CE30|nr:ABC transporter ATP-binding protein [Brevibacillus humidisoli]UFJ40177.1 ABC transporter ATP-binding protein [Brevibacillus humidisoli]
MAATSTNLLLEVKHLHAGFAIDGSFYNAVDDVSLTVEPGKIVCIVGESGCGKSVLALSIMNLLPSESGRIAKGEILFRGKELTCLSQEEMNRIRGMEIGMIFQEPMTALNPVFTIGFQLQECLLNHQNIGKREARKKSVELLKQVGIPRAEKVIDEYPHQLSGGMRQRVMIAMAIACNPQLLIADEPTTALDVTIQAQILELIKQVQQAGDMSVLLITHDLGVVAEMADEVIVMYAGQIVEQGAVDDIFHDPKHPYLRQLLKAIPRLDEDRSRLDSIGGIVPSLKRMPRTSCRFAGRCPEAKTDCYQLDPQLAHVGRNHQVRCLLYRESYPAKETGART